MTPPPTHPLPPVPDRMKGLPVQNGWTVPWFVAQTAPGVYDFRAADQPKIAIAHRQKKCWCCGKPLGAYKAFAIGPMCALNRTNAEPPSHRECAEWSAKACPFLAQRQLVRRETNLPDGYKEAAGIPILRQPGVVCIWVTNSYKLFRVPNGVLFELGEPTTVLWYREARPATRAEVLDSIDTGYPQLLALAETSGPKALKELEEKKAIALRLIPEE